LVLRMKTEPQRNNAGRSARTDDHSEGNEANGQIDVR
jgi:hypothetical protein